MFHAVRTRSQIHASSGHRYDGHSILGPMRDVLNAVTSPGGSPIHSPYACKPSPTILIIGSAEAMEVLAGNCRPTPAQLRAIEIAEH